MSKRALHYSKIGDAGGVPLQRCELSMSRQNSGQHIILKQGTQVFAVVDFGPAWVATHVER